jgi:hypothetical protein
MRIRTAVAAFAELCLTTRLCDLIIDLTFKIGAKIRPVLTFARNEGFIFKKHCLFLILIEIKGARFFEIKSIRSWQNADFNKSTG